MTDTVLIGLASWIINDGNYQNFERNNTSRFAVQFYAPNRLSLVEGDQPVSRESIDKNRYRIFGKVSDIFNDCWVIEMNGARYFTQQKIPIGAQPGSLVKGEVVLSVDPYFYAEHLSRQHDAPALIYNWKIQKIEIQMAPYLAASRGRVRDTSRLGWREIDKTQADSDDEGFVEYTLQCERENDLSER